MIKDDLKAGRMCGAVAKGVAACFIAPGAFAHPGHDTGGGLTAGFVHPFLGLDHLLAMIAVGILAGQRGGRALVNLPASFIVAMVFGAFLALHGAYTLPIVEQAVMASVLVLGVCVAMTRSVPYSAVLVLPALFAAFHGYAHMAEIQAGHSPMAYGAGFVVATAALQAIGIGLGLTFRRLANLSFDRFAGAAIAACGILLVAHIL